MIRPVGVKSEFPLPALLNPAASHTNEAEDETFEAGCGSNIFKKMRYFFHNIIVEIFYHSGQDQINGIVLHIGTG